MEASASRKPLSNAALLIILCLIGFAAISVDTLVPALPAIARDFAVSEQAAQSVLSLFVLGTAIGTLVCGIFADLHGRRHPILFGIAIYAVATVGCLASDSLEELGRWRFLQGIGAATGPTLAGTIISDVYGRRQAASMLGKLAGFMAFIPATGPFIGGVFAAHDNWEGIFAVLLLFALAVGAATHLMVPETHVKSSHMTRMSHYVGVHFRVLFHWPFLLYSLTGAFSFAGLFAFLSANSFILIDTLGVNEAYFGFVFLLIPAGFFCGSHLGARLVPRFGLEWTILIGATLSFFSIAVSKAFDMGGLLSLAIVLAPAFFFTAGVGMVLANSQMGAMKSRPMETAIASAVTGFVRLVAAAVVGYYALEGFDGDAGSMVDTMLACASVTLLIAVVIMSGHRKGVGDL